MSISHENKDVSRAATQPLPTPKRFNRILSIILRENPDVITLQELDHHYDFFKPELRRMGYDGFFQPKHISKGAEWNGGLPDGVAIFWNTQRIHKIKQVPVGWKDQNGNGTGSLTNAGVKKGKNNAPDKDLTGQRAKQVVMALHLQVIETKHDFLMMTAHVKSGEKTEDLPAKVAQGAEVADIIANAGMPVIFACDFNNRPGGDAHRSFFGQLAQRKTKVTSAYSNVLDEWRCVEETDNDIKPERFWKPYRDHSRLTPAEKESDEFQNGTCPRCKGNGIKMSDPAKEIQQLTRQLKEAESQQVVSPEQQVKLEAIAKKMGFMKKIQNKNYKLEAAILMDKKLTQEPEFTTAKWRKGGAQEDKRGITNQAIDYIFYTSEPRGEDNVALECSRVLGMTKEKIEAIYMPGWKYPSDHFMICADITFTEPEFSNRRTSSHGPAFGRFVQELNAQDEI